MSPCTKSYGHTDHSHETCRNNADVWLWHALRTVYGVIYLGTAQTTPTPTFRHIQNLKYLIL